MKITIIAVGKLKDTYWKEALAEYLQRLSAFARVEVIEVPDRGSHSHTQEQIKDVEGAEIIKHLQQLAQGSNSAIIALDGQGKQRSSEQMAKHFDDLKLRGKSRLVFIIGGSHGLSKEALSHTDESLSFGPQTWPHNMARVMLAEQIYRAFAISHNHPYHK